MPKVVSAPSEQDLTEVLGDAATVWSSIIEVVERACGEASGRQWTPSKSDFGRMCLLTCGRRTIFYLTPGRGQVTVAVVLGAAAFERAMSSSLSEHLKQMLSDARAYAEGRGIRFEVGPEDDLSDIETLVELKLGRAPSAGT